MSVGEFHRSLRSRGAGAKDWSNSFTEHEYLGVNEEGRHRFGVNISGDHRAFKDKVDGQWKKRKLTDNRPDHVVIQSAKVCVEVHPYYAKYFDVQHEEVRVEEERWVVQRLFKEPDTWRDVGAWNPVMAVEEYSTPAGEVIKVTITYDTDYGPFVLEYVQTDGSALKHNITFTNTSGGEETFRVIQRWAGIAGDQVSIHGKKHKVVAKTTLGGTRFVFGDDARPFGICESAEGVRQEGVTDVLEMLTGSREPVIGEEILVDKDGVKILVKGSTVFLRLDDKHSMISNGPALSIQTRAVEECPDDARVFIGGLGLGVFLFPLARSYKTTEIIVCENNRGVIDAVGPLVQEWFGRLYPNLNLTIIEGDVREEISKHGKFDWIFIDISNLDMYDLWVSALPYLTEGGKYTHSLDRQIRLEDRVLYLDPVEVDIHPRGLKADFIYGRWILPQNKALIIDPAVYSNAAPTEDSQVYKFAGSEVDCAADAPARTTGGIFGGVTAGAPSFYGRRSAPEWDISILAGATIDTNPIFKYEGFNSTATDSEINPLTEEAPSAATDANLWDYCASGVAYVNPFNLIVAINQSVDLGAAAKTDLQTAATAAQSWFALGFTSEADECGTGNFDNWDRNGTPPTTLYVTYTLPGGGGGAGAVVMGTKSLILDLLLEGVID